MTLLEEYKIQTLWRNWALYIENLPIRSQDIIIDIGCSIGTVSRLLAEKSSQVIGIDNNPELLCEAMKNNLADNISYRLMDAKSLKRNEFPLADGIWTSFLPAYIPDFCPVLKNWLQLLKPNGWIALVEMSDLFGHDPLSSSTHELFKEYYCKQLEKSLYDFEMGSKLGGFLSEFGLSVIYEGNMYDPELTFNGTAKPEILSAWKSRFERMFIFRQFLGDIKFEKIKDEFLDCLSNKDHSSGTIVKYIIASKENYHF